MTPHQKVDILRAACCVAGADGTTTTEERAMIDRLAGEIGVGEVSVKAMLARAESDSEFYRQQFRILKDDPQESMAILIEVGMADGQLGVAESNVLRGLARNLEVPDLVVDELFTRIFSMLDDSSGHAE